MGAILSFVPRNAVRKSAKPLPDGEGAIIIFPGVRYERPSKADEAASSARSAAAAAGDKGPSKH